MKKNSYNKGASHLGLEVLLLIVGVFIIWLIAGGAKKPTEDNKPFIKPLTDPVAPGKTYGPSEPKN